MMAKALRDCEEDVVRTMLQEINMLSDSAIEDAIELLFTDIIPDTDFESFPDFMGNITWDLEENLWLSVVSGCGFATWLLGGNDSDGRWDITVIASTTKRSR